MDYRVQKNLLGQIRLDHIKDKDYEIDIYIEKSLEE